MTEMTYVYDTLVKVTDEDLSPIDQGLHDYNVAHIGPEIVYDYHRIAVIARDAEGHLVGGIHGELVWQWLHIDTLWVEETHRKQGIGSTLLSRLEDAAVARGFFGAHLETTSFQALDFYRHHGYEVFGTLEGKPEGVTWYYMKKLLDAAP